MNKGLFLVNLAYQGGVKFIVAYRKAKKVCCLP